MSCLFPSRIVNARYKRNGTVPLVEALHYSNGEIPPDYWITIPCGRCPECRRRYRSQWRLRLLLEASYQSLRDCLFCSFTFDDKYLDFSTDSGALDRATAASYLRRFRDNLRKSMGLYPRYFAVSELGGETGRYHLHALLWFPRGTLKRVSYESIKNCWKFGFSWVSPIRSRGAFNYVTKYILKRSDTDPSFKPQVFCSTKIGLKRALELLDRDFFNKGSLLELCGFHYAVPVYFRRKILTTPLDQMFYSWRFANVDRPPSIGGISFSDPIQYADYRRHFIEVLERENPSAIPLKFHKQQNQFNNAFIF